MERIDPPLAGGELALLNAFLDFQRATLVQKAVGLDDRQAGTPSVPPSTLTISGLLKHMALVEANWFPSVS